MKNNKNNKGLKKTRKANNNAGEILAKLHLKPWHIFCFAAAIVLFCCSIKFNGSYKQIAEDRITREELDMDYIYFNVFVSDIQLGGLTKEQAARKLQKELQYDRTNGQQYYLCTTNGVYTKTITYDDMGVGYDIDGLVEQAYNYGRTGSVSDRLTAVRALQDIGKFIDPVMGYDNQKITDFVLSIEDEVNKSLDEGQQLNVERTVAMITQQLDAKEKDVTIYLPVK